ncbi:MAG: ABC transporter permease, partial [Pyrinomonadaceae bacterium]|nr:ABC transporter permease [Pyrinomonadaceae bacterium]
MWQDVRYGVRALWKSPGFTLVAVLALALGIGANTSLFSVVNAVLLRPLPFPEPERLVGVNSINLKNGDDQFGGASPADFLDWRAQHSSFGGITAYSGGSVNLSGGDQPEQFIGARVSDDFFKVFKVQPLLGRTILPEENVVRGNRVIVLSHRLWQRRFGGDPNVIGKTLTINSKSTTVVGVMPPDFKQPSFAEVWTPLLMDTGEMKPRESRYFAVNARLKDGVSLEQAQAEMNVIAGRLEAQHKESNEGWGVRLVRLHEQGVTEVRPALLILLGAVGFVLLIACVNVANLLLARATSRHKEVAIRTALGATRARIVRQLLIESLLLAFLGGGMGLLLALWGVDAITSLVPSDWRFPRLDESRIDGAVLGFTLGVSVLTGLLFGILPALKASNPNVYESLKETSRSATAGLRLQQLRGVLIVSEIALTLLLLVGAGLMLKSLVRLRQSDLGFNPRNILVMSVSPPLTQKYLQDDARSALYRQILEQVAVVPGVENVAANSGPPLASFGLNFGFTVEGREANTSDKQEAFHSAISHHYFQTMGVALRAGREFTEHDKKDAQPVVIINETMARRLFPDVNAVGQRLKIKHYMSGPVSHEIVGVAQDAKQGTLSDKIGSEMYVPDQQYPWLSTVLVVRAKNDPASLVESIKRAISMVDKDQPVTNIKTMDVLLSESVAHPRFYALLLGIFASLALVLAGVGIYGVMSYSVTQRTHEIGVRMALGAQQGNVLRLVVGQGMLLALVGVVVGLVGAFALTRVMESLLYGVSVTDPLTFVGVPLLLAGVALIACYLPARRAAKVDPMIALRY